MPEVIDIEERTLNFSISIIRFTNSLPYSTVNKILISQLVRSATSIGANIAEGRAGVSRKDFANFIGIAKKSAVETIYWLKLFNALQGNKELPPLLNECIELVKILSTIILKLK